MGTQVPFPPSPLPVTTNTDVVTHEFPLLLKFSVHVPWWTNVLDAGMTALRWERKLRLPVTDDASCTLAPLATLWQGSETSFYNPDTDMSVPSLLFLLHPSSVCHSQLTAADATGNGGIP